MENKQNIRKALKQINKLAEEMEIGMSMDNAMDGSGECGGIIANSWCNWFNSKVEQVLSETSVTMETLQKVTQEWANIELEKGPKQIFIPMYSRRAGMYKETDYFDTKWGSLNFAIHSSLNY